MSYKSCLVHNNVGIIVPLFCCLSVFSGSPLSVNVLLEAVSSVTDWHALGRQLGLAMSQLRGIELAYHMHGPDRLKAEMFDVWLKSSPNASWTDLITVLRAMGEDRVASDIVHQLTH